MLINNLVFVIKKLNIFAMQSVEKQGNVSSASRILNTCLKWLDYFGNSSQIRSGEFINH